MLRFEDGTDQLLVGAEWVDGMLEVGMSDAVKLRVVMGLALSDVTRLRDHLTAMLEGQVWGHDDGEFFPEPRDAD